MKRILIFSLAYEPFIGGAEVAVKQICKRLSDNEYYLICNRFDKSWSTEEMIDNVYVYRVGNGKWYDKYLYPFRAVGQAIKLNKEIEFDFAWSIMAFYAGFAALFFKYFTRTEYLLNLQSGDSDKFLKKRTWFWEFYYKRVYRRAKIVQAISKFLARRAKRMGYKKDVYIVPNGVDIDRWSKTLSDEEKSIVREELGIGDSLMLISTSRLVYKNGLNDLVRSMNFLKYKIGIDAKLALIGSGPEENNLKNLALQMSVDEEIIFVGHIENDELPKYVASADIFIRPSISEGLGISFLESMAAGTPIIATEVGGIPDFLEDGETGLYCKVGEPSSIALAVEKYVKDEGLYNRIREKGKQLVIEKYSWDKLALQMQKLFEKM